MCIAFIVRKCWQRRSADEQYIHFDNPIYRKKTQQNGNDVNRPGGMLRNDSQMELIEEMYAQGDAGKKRKSSNETESQSSPDSSNEHVYRPVSCVGF